MELGIKGTQTAEVTAENTAETLGSGALKVFATPAMVALMEKTAMLSVQPQLEAGQGTVGTLLNITHSAPSIIGAVIRCESELVEIDRRRLVFHVAAYDDAGLIGEGTHERFIIDNEKFMSKAEARR